MKIICGFGVNDLPKGSIGRVKPEFYKMWVRIMHRSYNPIVHARQPAYEKCSVSPLWRNLSDFKAFHDENFTLGWELDKDLIKPGNTVYGPEYCVFLPKWLNRFVRNTSPTTGTCFHRNLGLYGAYGFDKNTGSKTFLGYYSTVKEAHEVWLKDKLRLALEYKEFCDSVDRRLYAGIVNKLTMRS